MEYETRDKILQEYYKLTGSDNRFYDIVIEIMRQVDEKVKADEYTVEIASGILSCTIAQLVEAIAKIFAALWDSGWINDEILAKLQDTVREQLNRNIREFSERLRSGHE